MSVLAALLGNGRNVGTGAWFEEVHHWSMSPRVIFNPQTLPPFSTSRCIPLSVFHEVLPLLRHHRVKCAWMETSHTMSQCSVFSAVCRGPSSFQVGFLRFLVIATKHNTEMMAGSIADTIKIKWDVTLQPSSILLVYMIQSHI